jgi:hypothetical protein
MVIQVQTHESQSPGDGLTIATDRPLSSHYYSYDVSLRVDRTVFVGRYETAFHDLPSAFTAGQPIRVRAAKRLMHFDLPNNRDLTMTIARRKIEPGATCRANP